MNVLLSPHPSLLPHQHETTRLSPPRSSSLSPYSNMSSRKRKADDDGDESMSPLNSPALSSRQLARPSKKVRSSEVTGRPLALPRLLETLDTSQLRTVLRAICERHPDIGQEVVSGAPRPTVGSSLQVLAEYQEKLQAAMPYGQSSSDYNYYRVKQPLAALVEAISDFTPQYLPPLEMQASTSLQYLDGATKVIHQLPEWDSPTYRQHKESAYDEISRAWALVINEASKRGGGFVLLTGGWDQTLSKHNQRSGGRLEAAMSAMATNLGWMGHNNNNNNNPNAGPSSISSSNSSSNGGGGGPNDQNSILNQLMNGTYGAPVRVGPW